MKINIDKYIGDEASFSFSHRILNILLLFGILLSLVSGVFDFLVCSNIYSFMVDLICLIIPLILYYLSLVHKTYDLVVNIGLFIFIAVIVPSTLIGGVLSGGSFFIVVLAGAISVLLNGTKRILVLVMMVLTIVLLAALQYKYPGLVVQYNCEMEKYADCTFGLILNLIANAALIAVILIYFIKEQQKAKDYALQIEKQKYELEMARLDRLNLIGKMAASVGHEVRNPLTVVRGFLQLFIKIKENDAQHDKLCLMLEELDRADAIIEEFLSLARQRMLVLKQTDLNQIIQNLYPLVSCSILSEGKKLILQLGDIPLVMAEENEVKQLILNLIRNAQEAVDKQGEIRIATKFENGKAYLMIKDDGPGIPTEIMDKLGTPFITTKESGTGLGLAICLDIARRHASKLEVLTGSGGTTFIIGFDIARQ